MLNIFANSFMTATRNTPSEQRDNHSHWAPSERFDNRRNAEMEAHLTARRRD
ncbi:hypothetical protein [Roseovarius faecimaris]|uniref:hypothetical protein n=1 Tax=Roseovarius faecimaris TaxID=2494550 RepID=UPI0018DF4260|nr:hypothetical protein [Roseovarius faecimaris]